MWLMDSFLIWIALDWTPISRRSGKMRYKNKYIASGVKKKRPPALTPDTPLSSVPTAERKSTL